MKRKGISPLVATVILIAIGIFLAAVLSPYLTRLFKKRLGTSEKQEKEIMRCTGGAISIHPDPIHIDKNISLILEHEAGTKVINLQLIAYNGTEVPRLWAYNVTPSSLERGEIKRLESTGAPENVTKITIKSKTCPQIKSTVEWNKERKKWERVY